jgi:phage terminase large subunit-like protein
VTAFSGSTCPTRSTCRPSWRSSRGRWKEGRPVEFEENSQRHTIDWTSDVLSYFWMPRQTLHKRAQEDGVPYPEWVRAGYVFESAGALVDHDQIVDFIVNSLAKKYRIRRIGVDAHAATALVTRLRRHFGTFRNREGEQEVVLEIPQGFRALSAATKLVQALAIAGLMQHDGNPCMAWNIGNMAFEENAWRELRPVKMEPKKRIDGGVALIDAHAALLLTPQAPRRAMGAMIL